MLRPSFLILSSVPCLSWTETALSFTLGPEALMTYPSPSPYQFPDAAFSVQDDGDARLMFWSDGTTYRVRGTGLFPNSPPSPLTPVLGSGTTSDRNGNWLLAAFRVAGGDLVAFTHVEDHSFDCPGSYAEWNAGAVVSSSDDGITWVRDGLAISDPKPCKPTFGGTGYSSIISAPNGAPGFIAYGGCTAFRSTDARGAPGTWQRWKDGSFSSPGVNGSSTCLNGVSANVCCPTVTYNSDLNIFIMISTTWGLNNTLFIATSTDGLDWASPQILLQTPTPRAIAYGQLIGVSNSSVSGRVSTLAYAAAPPTGNKPRDFVYRNITFTGATPALKTTASPRRIAFSWDKVPVFQHLASVNASLSTPFPPARLAWLASRFPVIVLEHAHAMGAWAYNGPSGPDSTWGPKPFLPPGSGYIEDQFAAAAKAIKALNSSVTVLYYQQITGALPYYRASSVVTTAGFALDANCQPVRSNEHTETNTFGDILPNYVTYAWDHTAAGVTANFVSAFKNLTQSVPAIDGTFIDTASCYASTQAQQDASDATVRAMQAAVPDKIVGFHTESTPFSGASAYMDYTFAEPSKKRLLRKVTGKPNKDTSGKAAVEWLDANAAAGAISFAHIGDVDGGADQVYSLAVFLAGVYDQAYFAFSSAEKTAPAWVQCDPAAPTWPAYPTWCTGQGYTADYDRPLGAPLGPRSATGGARDEVTRSFASGTHVTVELSGSACTIAWADGTTTTCA